MMYTQQCPLLLSIIVFYFWPVCISWPALEVRRYLAEDQVVETLQTTLREIQLGHIFHCEQPSNSTEKVLYLLETALDSPHYSSILPDLLSLVSYPHDIYTLVKAYERILSAWQCVDVVSNERRNQIALSMQAHAKSVPIEEAVMNTNNSVTWTYFVGALLQNELKYYSVFHEYYLRKLHPKLFHWPLANKLLQPPSGGYFVEIGSDPLFQHAMTRGERFMYQKVPTITHTNGIKYRSERIQHVYFWALFKNMTGIDASDIEQLVEYGCGTGDNAPLLDEIGFRGVHLMYDLPYVLFAQQYFLRYSGHATYLAPRNTSIYKRVLVPATDPAILRAHVDTNLKYSMFLATYSLTESQVYARDLVLNEMKGTGIYYVIGGSEYEKVNNVKYLKDFATSLGDEYNVCVMLLAMEPRAQLRHKHVVFVGLKKGIEVKSFDTSFTFRLEKTEICTF